MAVVTDRGDWLVIESAAGRPGIAFQYAPDHKPPRWPDPEFPQQFHLDVNVDDVDIAEQQVLALGATRLPGQGEDFRVYADTVHGQVGHGAAVRRQGELLSRWYFQLVRRETEVDQFQRGKLADGVFVAAAPAVDDTVRSD